MLQGTDVAIGRYAPVARSTRIGVGGGQLNRTSSPPALRFLDGGGEMGALMRAHNWSATPLGPEQAWPQALRTALRLLLNTGHPMFVFWGPEHLCFYNDAYRLSIGDERHPAALGQPGRAVWDEIWDIIGPDIEQVMRGDGATWHENALVPITRNGVREDVWWTYSYGPIDDATMPNGVGGILVVCTETTEQVLSERRASGERARLQALFENAPGFIAILDGPGHVFTFVNDAYRDLTGHREYVGRTARDAFPEIEGQGFFEMLDKVHATGQAVVAEQTPIVFATLGKAAETRYIDFVYQPMFDDDGSVTGIFVEGQDRTEDHLSQQALAESEGRFRAAVQAVEGVLWTNSPDGEMLGDQHAWGALTGQTRAQYEGYGWADAVHPDDAHPTIDAWKAAVAERRLFAFEHRVRTRNDEFRLFSIRAIPVFDQDDAIVEWVGVHTDITDARATEQALIESGEHYRNAAELNPQVAWTATPDGQLDRVAERWREWTGTSGLGSSWSDGLHTDDLGYSAAAWAHSVATGDPYDVEYRVKHVDGRYRWARSRAWPRRDGAGAIVKWYGQTEDTDARKQAEIRAFDSARELRGVIETMPGFVWTADDQGGLLYTSPSWHSYSGSQPDDSNGAGWAGFVHPDDRDTAFASWAASLNSGEPYEVEFRLRARDGSHHWWLARAQKQPEGGWIGTATELDAIVEARNTLARSRELLEREVEARTAELRETEEQLRQSQKLEAIGQLTGGVAHDFNNLLTVIRGSVDLLQRPGITDEKRDRYIGAIGDTVVRAAKLTGQLLAFARRQALQPDSFGVGDALTGIADMIGTLSGSRIRVEIAAPAEPLFVHADPSQFDTAIVNMVANARDAMGGEGTLTIDVHAADGISASGGPAVVGDYVAVAITDTGAGIAPEKQLQIFEPFYTTKSVGQGTGLGLSQVYGFAKQSGGEIRLISKPGEGATFTLYLPRVSAPAQARAIGEASRVSEGGGTCVLVVEDNPDVGQFARDTLAELGYDPVFAEDGAAALEILAQDAGRLDVVFSDVMMPGMSGIELGEEVRRLYPGLPVVLTSGYSHVLAEQGSSGFELLHKPYSMEELSAVLQRAAARRQLA